MSTCCGYAQVFTDKIIKELKFEKKSPANTLILANVNGSIKAEGYDGDKILIEAERTIKAKTDTRLEQGKKELQLKQIDRLDTLIVYVSNGCNHFSYERKKHQNGWGYSWDCDESDCNPPYDYVFNFIVKVPAYIHLEVGTINQGSVVVSGMKGMVKATNVNGAIKLTALEGYASANTINGDVDIDYLRNPNQDGKYYSLNGDINAWFVKGLSATISFKSFNGSLYTNVDKLQELPAVLEKKQSENGIKLKISHNRFKVGNGGVLQDFETFNGDVIVKEK
jgi:hypothetical protein